MKLKIKHKMTFDEADKLIEKYYEGFTTVDEEIKLKKFLSQTNLPSKYKPEQDILGFFEKKKRKPTFSIRPYIRRVSVAAVLIATLISVQLFITENPTNYAYVNGVKITNPEDIKTQALISLNNVTSERNEVEETLNQLNDRSIMQQQLNVFSALE